MSTGKGKFRNSSAGLLIIGIGLFLNLALQAATTGCSSAPPGLVGWWPGDGSATDIAGGNNGALLGDATANGVGLVGSALSFDGTNGYVQIPDTAALRPTNLTVEAWVRFNSLDSAGTAPAGQQYIVFKQNTLSSYFEGYYLGKIRIAGADRLTFIVASAGAPATDQMAVIRSTTVVAPGVWYHVAGVRGPNYTELYVNGQLESRTNANFTQDYGDYPLYFGSSGQSYWDRKFNGLLDEVGLYNRALSSNEVAAIYAAGAAGKCKAPAITAHPASQEVVAGTSAQFTVTATGYGTLGYQWRFNDAPISGGTGVSLTLPNVQPPNAGSYTVVVTNTLGAVTSAVATLTVWVPPTFSAQPQSRTNVFGTDASFSATGTGTPAPSYQWEFKGAAIPGATGTSFLRSAVSFADAGEYRVVLTNIAGSATSAAAVLTVTCPAVTVEPTALPATVVGSAYSQNLTASGGNGPYSFAVTAGALPAGLTLSSTGLLDGTPTAIGTDAFTVTATDTNGCTGDRAYSIAVTGVPPVITLQPQSRTNTIGTDASFTVTATGTPPPGYQWEFNGEAIPGATTSTLIRSAVKVPDAGPYRVVVANAAGTLTSDVAILTVVCPSVTVSPASLPNGAVGSPYSQNLSASGGSGPYRFAVTDGTLPSGLDLSPTGVLAGTPTASGTSNFTITATDTNGCSGSRAFTVVISGTQPVFSLQPQDRTNVLGTDAMFAAAASGNPPPAYQWQFSGLDIPGATGSAFVRSAVSFADAGEYRVIASNNVGTATSDVATLTVVCPAVAITPATLPNAPVGASYSQTLTASGGSAPYSFAVTSGELPDGLQLSGTGIFSGAPTAIGTNTFTVTATDTNGCSGNQSLSIAVTVAPPLITLQPQSLIREVGTMATFSVAATGAAPLSYQWMIGGSSLTDDGRMSGVTTDTLQIEGLLTNDAGDYAVIVSNAAGVTTSDVATLLVTLPVTCVTPAAGLVGWWAGEGDAGDLAGTNNGALLGGATAGAAGFVGSAFSMDGTNGYVSIPDSPALRPTNLTIEAWVWFNSLNTPASGGSPAGQQYLVFKENTHSQAFEGYALTKERIGGRDVFSIAVSSATGQTAGIISQTLVVTGAWYHVAAVRGSNLLQLYVNGQMESQTNVSFAQNYGNYPLFFGSSGQPTWDHKFSGRLDEISLYNRALSSSEIAAIYASGASGKCKAVAITSQPQSQTTGAGSNVAFSVTASGSAPLSYRWQRGGVNLANGGAVSGAYSAALHIANVSSNDNAGYRVVVTNMLGSATSAIATLTVVPELFPPVITAQPTSQTANAGTNVTFSVDASGTAPFTYQWRFNGINLAPSAQHTGVTGPTLAISYVLPANSGGYSVIISNGAGAVTSDVATLTVSVPNGCLPPPPGIVGWWPGDGSVRDIVSTNNGTLMGNAVANADGFTGQAFSFDGTNGYVRIPDSPAFHPTNLTVECWVRFAAYQTPGNTYYPNQQYIVFKQNTRYDEFEGFALTKDHDPQGDVFLWEVASASGELIRVDTISTVVTGVWYHVVGVRGPDYVELYKDGLLEVRTNVNFVQDYGNNPLYFGTSGQSYYDRRLHADLDEVALYNRALSAEEIATLYAAGAAGKCKGTNGVSITLQPQSQAAMPGTNVTLLAAATGLAPLAFQWQLNGASIVGATDTSLLLTNVQTTNSGSYRVVVSNPAGSVISDTAAVTVGSPPVLLSPHETGDGMFSFTVSGSSGVSYIIERTTSFQQWIAVTTVTTTAGEAAFSDPAPPDSAPRFYRARLAY